MGEIYYFVIVVNLALIFKLYWDHRIRTKFGRVINHSKSLLIDITIYSVASILLFNVSWFGFALVVLATLYRGLVFDLLYNLTFHNKWSYCGNNSKIDEWSDKIDGKDDQDCVVGFFLKIFLIGLIITLIAIL